MSFLVEASHLKKSFGTTHAVQDVSLNVRAGEAYGLVGPDGAGKTTALRLLVGALQADTGSARVGGWDVAERPEEARATLGYLAQRFSLYGDLTVLENLKFFGEVRGVVGQRFAHRAETLLNFVGLGGFESRRAEQLSGGMKQKLGLACALIHEPKVLLLDEPTTGVDPVTRQDFWQLLIRVLGEGTAVIVSTPYMDEAIRCNRIGFMHSGKILVEGTPRELTQPLIGRVWELLAQPKQQARAIAQRQPDVRDVLTFGDRLHLHVAEPAEHLAQLSAALTDGGVQVQRLRPIPPSLEDVFIHLLKQ
jgi:ABC-2 type transport system ATP-binding protein